MFGMFDQNIINNSITICVFLHCNALLYCYYVYVCIYRTMIKVHFMKVIAIATQDYKVWVVFMWTGCENYIITEVMMGHTMKDKFNDHKKV